MKQFHIISEGIRRMYQADLYIRLKYLYRIINNKASMLTPGAPTISTNSFISFHAGFYFSLIFIFSSQIVF